MKCEESAELVSAVCDGELIPPEAAEHIGECRECHALLNEYVRIGAELRRLASLEMSQAVAAGVWGKKRWRFSAIWQKGWETMRIPKLAFATLVLATLALGSGLVMTKVRAQAGGPVVVLTVTPDGGEANRCALSIRDPKFHRCAAVEMVKSGLVEYEVEVLGDEGGRMQLGVRSRFVTPPGPESFTLSAAEFADLPQQKYWFEVGQRVQAEIPGVGLLTITGEYLDHIPTTLSLFENNQLEPRANELRITSPLLLRDNRTVFDLQSMILLADHDFKAVEMYEPGLGRYIYSLAPLRGSVEGKVEGSRISYELDGHKYQLLTGAPVTRASRVWVLQQPQYKLSQDSSARDDASFGGTVDPKTLRDLLVSN